MRLPGKGNSNHHGARPVRRIILMMKWIWTRMVSIKNSLPLTRRRAWSIEAWYRGTLFIRNSAPLGPYSKTMPRALRWS